MRENANRVKFVQHCWDLCMGAISQFATQSRAGPGQTLVIRQCRLHYLVCPKADTYSITSSARAKNRRWKLDAERFGRAQIDQKLELGRLFHR